MPPVICTATSKRTGEPCRQYAIVGGTVCFWHGGGRRGRTKDAAERRITLAQLFEQSPREHPWEIVLDATHRMDVIFRDLWAQVVAGETIGTEQLDRLINFNQIRHHLAKTAIDTKAHEQVSLAFTRHLEMEGQLVGTALGAAIDGLGLTEPWRRYALELAHWTLGEGDTSRGDEPRPPDEPIVREYDVRPRGTVPALEAGTAAAVSPCDVAGLDDDALKALGEAVLDELGRRDVA
jgi:hypothetical protein